MDSLTTKSPVRCTWSSSTSLCTINNVNSLPMRVVEFVPCIQAMWNHYQIHPVFTFLYSIRIAVASISYTWVLSVSFQLTKVVCPFMLPSWLCQLVVHRYGDDSSHNILRMLRHDYSAFNKEIVPTIDEKSVIGDRRGLMFSRMLVMHVGKRLSYLPWNMVGAILNFLVAPKLILTPTGSMRQPCNCMPSSNRVLLLQDITVHSEPGYLPTSR